MRDVEQFHHDSLSLAENVLAEVSALDLTFLHLLGLASGTSLADSPTGARGGGPRAFLTLPAICCSMLRQLVIPSLELITCGSQSLFDEFQWCNR